MEREWFFKHCASLFLHQVGAEINQNDQLPHKLAIKFKFDLYITFTSPLKMLAITNQMELGDAYMSYLFYTSINNRPSNLKPEKIYLVEL